MSKSHPMKGFVTEARLKEMFPGKEPQVTLRELYEVRNLREISVVLGVNYDNVKAYARRIRMRTRRGGGYGTDLPVTVIRRIKRVQEEEGRTMYEKLWKLRRRMKNWPLVAEYLGMTLYQLRVLRRKYNVVDVTRERYRVPIVERDIKV